MIRNLLHKILKNQVIQEIYKKFSSVEFDINYSLENKIKAKEIMIFSKNIKNYDIFTEK